MTKRITTGILATVLLGAALSTTAYTAEKIKRDKLQVFVLLGQSNMVGLADIRSFEYLLQDPYLPRFDEARPGLEPGVYYANIFSKFGFDLERKMYSDPKYFTMHPRELKGKFRGEVIRTIPDDQRITAEQLYEDMIGRTKARIPLRKRMAERYLKGKTRADFEGLGELVKAARNSPETKADPRAERLAYAKLVQQKIGLPIARRTWISGYGAFQAVDSLDDSNIRRIANGPLSIGWGAGYTRIGPEYGFGIAMEEKLDAPILIIKCAWGNTQLCGAWRPPSAPPRTETAEEKKNREAKNAALKKKAEAEGAEFKPLEAPRLPSPGWCWDTMKFQEHIKKVLADPGKYHPEYDENVGFEVAGMLWFQGHSDAGYRNGTEYKSNMTHFSRDLRKLTETPDMPVVIGTVSTDVHKPRVDASPVVQSQIAVAELPEFEGTVTTVRTVPFYPTELSVLNDMMYKARKATEKAIQEGKTEPNYRTDPQYAEWAKYKGVSNRSYHYMGSAECFVEMGDAFAEAMAEMIRSQGRR